MKKLLTNKTVVGIAVALVAASVAAAVVVAKKRGTTSEIDEIDDED